MEGAPAVEPTPLPPGWQEAVDATTQATYYWNTATNAVQWDRPTLVAQAASATDASAQSNPDDASLGHAGHTEAASHTTASAHANDGTHYGNNGAYSAGQLYVAPVSDTCWKCGRKDPLPEGVCLRCHNPAAFKAQQRMEQHHKQMMGSMGGRAAGDGPQRGGGGGAYRGAGGAYRGGGGGDRGGHHAQRQAPKPYDRPPNAGGSGRPPPRKTGNDDGIDPMDPASYADVPRGNWSAGLKEDDDPVTGVDSSATGPLFQSRPLPSPGDILRAKQAGAKKKG